MASAAREKRVEQACRKRLEQDAIETHEADVDEGGGQAPGVLELGGLARGISGEHGSTDIEQQANRHARLDLEHFEEELFEAHVGAPVDGAEIVARIEGTVIEKLLTGAGEARDVVAADKTAERLLPMQSQPLELFQKAVLQKRLVHGALRIGCAFEDFAQDGFSRVTVGVGVEVKDDAVTEHGGGDGSHVVEAQMQAPTYEREYAPAFDQGLGAPG